MRLWSLHPKYLDSRGLVALWRETLLARAVLRGQTRGYRHHPQLTRFRAQPAPRSAINAYLHALYIEGVRRGYRFDRTKIGPVRKPVSMLVSSAQLQYEWRHLLGKLRRRDPALHRKWRLLRTPAAHPCFHVRSGGVASWERLASS
jgi:hypothetical protein